MTDLDIRVTSALEVARELTLHGVPVFICKPVLDGNGKWRPDANDPRRAHVAGYKLPPEWQQTTADPAVVDRWRPGQALCMVTGVALDVVDIDPRNGGGAGAVPMPMELGLATTPSGGTHHFVSPLGVTSRDNVVSGVDVKAGVDGKGRGFVFLAPTRKLSKETGELAQYRWTEEPYTDLIDGQGDPSGDALRDLITALRLPSLNGQAYDGPVFGELNTGHQDWAARHTTERLDYWRDRLAAVAELDEGEEDAYGCRWEESAKKFAWELALLTAAPWTPLTVDDAETLHDEILPRVLADNPSCGGKLVHALSKASVEPALPSPWADFDDGWVDTDPRASKPKTRLRLVGDDERAPSSDFAGSGPARRSRLERVPEAGNEAHASDWLAQRIGTGPLSGMFLRGELVVHTPQIGEKGFQSLRKGAEVKPDDYEGPAQVREVDADQLVAEIQFGFKSVRVDPKGKETRILFPRRSAVSVLKSVRNAPNLRELTGVTHTPVVRADGSVLSSPGYDLETGYLYLPMRGCGVPGIPDEPSEGERVSARALLDDLLHDYRFTHERYRANYLTYLLTPLLRLMCPPTYPLFVFDARKPGSGKTMLAKIGHVLHGGTFRAAMPPTEEELAKEVTTILSANTAPCILFDNVKGTVRSSKLEGLLTSAVWEQRMLGGNVQVSRPNDRVWSVTANNAQLGNDLARRSLRVDIDPEHAFPHMRPASSFRHPRLMEYLSEQRGPLTWALLTLIRAWVAAGGPAGGTANDTTADNYAALLSVCNGILSYAGYEGVAGEKTSDEMMSEDDRELSTFLSAIYRVFGNRPWTVKQVLQSADHASDADDFAEEDSDPKGIPGDVFPSHVSTHEYDRDSASRKLGHWLRGLAGRGCISLDGSRAMQVVQHENAGKHAAEWRIETGAI